jgi:hypothetical protein
MGQILLKIKVPKKEIDSTLNIWGDMTRTEYEKYNRNKSTE